MAKKRRKVEQKKVEKSTSPAYLSGMQAVLSSLISDEIILPLNEQRGSDESNEWQDFTPTGLARFFEDDQLKEWSSAKFRVYLSYGMTGLSGLLPKWHEKAVAQLSEYEDVSIFDPRELAIGPSATNWEVNTIDAVFVAMSHLVIVDLNVPSLGATWECLVAQRYGKLVLGVHNNHLALSPHAFAAVSAVVNPIHLSKMIDATLYTVADKE